MTLGEHPIEFQHKVVIRLWLALGIKAHELADDAVEELLAEWCGELAGFTLEQIDHGRQEAVQRSGTLPADQFRDLCRQLLQPPAAAESKAGLSDVAQRELGRMRTLFNESDT